MLCERAKPFNDENYIAETKLDGERIIFIIDKKNKKLTIQNREGFDKTISYPEFDNIFDYINCDTCILDGELIGGEGKSIDFYNPLFSRRTHIGSRVRAEQLAKIYPLNFMIFDILEIDGQNITQSKLLDRKDTLRKVVKDNDRIKVIDFVNGSTAVNFYTDRLEKGFEGIVIKKIDSTYENKRSSNWFKCKPLDYEIVKVLSYKETSGWGSWGALITEMGDVALETEIKKNEYFRRAKLGEVKIEVRFQELTPDGKFRFPKLNKFMG
jgi:ATP-dependent DNA ligase